MIRDFGISSRKVSRRNLVTLVRQLGLSTTTFRFWYEVQHWLGLMERRFPSSTWEKQGLARWLKSAVPGRPDEYGAYRQENSPSFFTSALTDKRLFSSRLREVMGDGLADLVAQADQASKGALSYFEHTSEVPGMPLDWHSNPITGQQVPPDVHWSKIAVFSPLTGDVKFYWEPSRFAIAFKLTRAYWVTGNDEYTRIFWELVESWRDANPPQTGVNWKCGQEISLRLMAWIFALYGMMSSPHTTPERIGMLSAMIAVQTDRVERNIAFARSLKNNHAISEAVGLWTVGILFPEFTAAARWRESGRKVLEEAAQEQIYDDGSYIQQSTNYHRLMLHDYLWAIRLGNLNGYELSPLLLDRVRKAGEFLHQLQDEESGCVPNYGANDGALILPLNSCDYRDFRPVLGSIHYLFSGTCLYEPGPWDEDLLWLFGPDALDTPREAVAKRPLNAPVGGYYTLRGGKSWGMIRCATFRDRPSQADMLHLDIWRNGVNVACDAGSFLYYAEPPWNNALVSTQVHNTVSVDGLDQMERGPRFLWLNWLESRARHYITSDEGSLVYFEGEHYGYKRLQHEITHRRAVLKAAEDIWVVVDDLLGDSRHKFVLHWLLSDLAFKVDVQEMQISLDMGMDRYGLWLRNVLPESARSEFDVVRGNKNSAPRGWHSAYYGVRSPALSVVLGVDIPAPCRLVSVFAPEKSDSRLSISAERICLQSQNSDLTIDLLAPCSQRVMAQAMLDTQTVRERIFVA